MEGSFVSLVVDSRAGGKSRCGYRVLGILCIINIQFSINLDLYLIYQK